VANTVWVFDTFLVDVRGPAGQTADRHFAPLIGFTWTFTENATGTGSTISALSSFAITNQVIANINTALQAAQNNGPAPNNNFASWTAISSDQMCPEPGTVIMLFIGLSVVAVSKFRRAA
jgi:hypothetical protein